MLQSLWLYMTIVTSPTISLIITPSVSALPPGRVLVLLFSFYFLTPYSCVLTPWSYFLTSHKCIHGLVRFPCPACDLGSYCSSSHPKYFTAPCLQFIFKIYIYIYFCCSVFKLTLKLHAFSYFLVNIPNLNIPKPILSVKFTFFPAF